LARIPLEANISYRQVATSLLRFRDTVVHHRFQLHDSIDIGVRITEPLTREPQETPVREISVAAVAGLAENALQHMVAQEFEKPGTVGDTPNLSRLEVRQHQILLLPGQLQKRGSELIFAVPFQPAKTASIARQK
jgi:hypothetical protein